MADEAVKSPAEERADRLESLRSEWNQLSERVSLGHLNDELEDIGSKINGLPHQIDTLRKRGYFYGRGWSAQAETLEERWPDRRREAKRIIRERERDLDDLEEEIEDLCDRARLSEGALDRLENLIERAESRISSAESSVRGTYDGLQEQLTALEREMYEAETTLDALDGASFEMFPDEHIVASCKAIWVSDRDEPEGLLFLSNGRIVFEQREKKATKKVLFITTKSEMVQEKLWESPVGAIAEMDTEDQKGGFLGLGRKEILTLRFRERTRELPSDVTLRLRGTDNEAWKGLIKRVQSGEIEADRYDVQAPEGEGAAPPPPPTTPPSEIPTQCSNCGGQLPTVFKGMREVTCEYCGTKIRF